MITYEIHHANGRLFGLYTAKSEADALLQLFIEAGFSSDMVYVKDGRLVTVDNEDRDLRDNWIITKMWNN